MNRTYCRNCSALQWSCARLGGVAQHQGPPVAAARKLISRYCSTGRKLVTPCQHAIRAVEERVFNFYSAKTYWRSSACHNLGPCLSASRFAVLGVDDSLAFSFLSLLILVCILCACVCGQISNCSIRCHGRRQCSSTSKCTLPLQSTTSFTLRCFLIVCRLYISLVRCACCASATLSCAWRSPSTTVRPRRPCQTRCN